MKTITHILLIALVIFTFGACQDETFSDDIYKIEIYLTDDPLNAEEVNIEILGVILIGDDDTEPIELNTISGIYNLLDFQGDVDTLIASGNYDLNSIKEIRLLLGENNSIKIDGQIYPLTIPAGADSGLKIKINKELIGQSLVSLLIDFDACKSVKEVNGEYKLSPVIHFKGDRNIRSLDIDYVAALDSCYMLNYPLEAKDTNGDIIEVTSSSELADLIVNELITGVVYPLIIIEDDGKERKINNHNQAERWIEDCIKEEEEVDYLEIADFLENIDSCYNIQYPLSLILDDGSMVEVNSNEELLQVENAVEVVFPFYLIDGDKSKKINNENQLEAQLKNCTKKDDEEEEEEEEYEDFEDLLDKLLVCYELSFPLSVELNDSSMVEVFDVEALEELVGEGNVYGFIYEITITDKNGTMHVISNNNQLKGLLNHCKTDEKESDLLQAAMQCHTLVLPIEIEKESGDKVLIEDLNQLQELFDAGVEFEIEFPITLIDAGGKEKKVNNKNKLAQLSKKC